MTSISVVTPSYGYGRFIEDAIQSILRQPVGDIQFVIQDGASKDETVDILKRYEKDLEWVSEPDEGQSDALNKALERATGDWIAWLNADEFFLPGGISRLVEVGERSGADLVFGDAVFVTEDGRLQRLLAHHPFSPLVLRWHGRFISTCSMVIRRSALGTNPLDPRMKRIMDVDLFRRFLREGKKFEYYPFPSGTFRVHGARTTAQPTSEHAWDYEELARRYGGKASRGQRFLARSLRSALKAASGGYRRQMKASSLAGLDLRWFADPAAARNVGQLITTCYPKERAIAVTTPGPSS